MSDDVSFSPRGVLRTPEGAAASPPSLDHPEARPRSTMSVIARTPATPPATSPNDPRYYEARDLEAELRRTFQICHECRMCVGYCGSFPSLFNRIDKAIDSGAAEGAETLDNADFKAIGDECWQCKLCYI
jgi:glycerol-3-phosphate dehydrogenase subunit C